MKWSCQLAEESYQDLLTRGVCPEQARMVLPQCMMTEFIETGSLAAYARLCKLRQGEDAQKEIRDVAGEVSKLLSTHFPASWAALTC
jgi:thymidylate synthase (FAD)